MFAPPGDCCYTRGEMFQQGFSTARELAKTDVLFDGKAAGSSSSGSPKTFAADTRDKDNRVYHAVSDAHELCG